MIHFKKSMVVVQVLLLLVGVDAYKACSLETGGGICPDHNTCCSLGQPGVSSCIPHPRGVREGEESDCCTDDGLGLTGCEPGYKCMSKQKGANLRNKSSIPEFYCRRIDPDYNGTKPKPLILPRYRLVTLPPKTLTQVYGLPLLNSTTRNEGIAQQENIVNVAYFSTMGSLSSTDSADLQKHQRVSTVFIMVHGSRRNAADYLYAAFSSLPKDQQDSNNSTVMVLSPWFLSPQDNNLTIPPVESPITTNRDNQSKSIPIPLPPCTLRWLEDSDLLPHPWRAGENAMDSTISSFDALDTMVELLVNDPVRFPSLQKILVAGHSAGGQFVQRWALLSNSPVWNQEESQNSRNVMIQAIPANPRCFAFLDDRRFVLDLITNQTVFRRPRDEDVSRCTSYDQWIWGLEPGGNFTVPYKERAIADAGGAQAMAIRYITSRRVVYLAGGEDLQVFDDDCGSVMQGKTRRERSHHFFKSLLEAYPEKMKNNNHKRLVVPGVPHDHTLMYQSAEGQNALFGGDSSTIESFNA